MIDRIEKQGNLLIYYISKDYDNAHLENVMNTNLKREDTQTIIDHDADVYGDPEGKKLLLRFRKKQLTDDNVKLFYDNVIRFAMNKSSNRGSASGSKTKNIFQNPKIMSNIIGYYDKFSPSQKFKLRRMGKTIPKITVRKTQFVEMYPERFERTFPLIQEIDNLYEQIVPDNHAKQKQKATETSYHIAGTSFTTATLNVNYQTTVHKDQGDSGFGNLIVIEHGSYLGGETCFPQYGIGVDVRTNDILFMDVHEPHGNLPIELQSADAKRLSIVCYLRMSIWKQTRQKSEE